MASAIRLFSIPPSDDPAARVKVVSTRDWIVTLDLSADEFYGSEQVKRAFVRYSLKVTRLDIDPERNPYGLALDCYSSPPERIALPTSATGAKGGPSVAGAAPAPATPAAQGNSPFMSDTPSPPPSAAQGATP